MKASLALSRAIDTVNTRIAQLALWLVLIVTLISAGNATVRYLFDRSSNAWLELQWYLFAAIFLLCAPYTLLRNDMVRIDVIAGRFSKRAQAFMDIFGTIFFLLPVVGLIGILGWPLFTEALARQEMSSNAGGLIIWPARLLLPVGMALLALQGFSQIIKQIAFLRGLGDDPNEKQIQKTPEQELAEEIARRHSQLPQTPGTPV